MTYCINCGTKNEDDSAFCIACGTPLVNSEPTPENERDIPSVDVAEVTAVASEEEVVAEQDTSEQSANDRAFAATERPTSASMPQSENRASHDEGVIHEKGADTQAADNTKGLKLGKPKKNVLIIGIAAAVVVVAVIIGLIMGLGVGGTTVKNSVDEYTWEELSHISKEIANAPNEEDAIEIAKKYHLTTASGMLDGTQVKAVALSNGQFTQVQIVGFAHDDKSEGGKAGITFIFKDAVSAHDMNSSNVNTGGWADSQMRSWLAAEGISLLPPDLRDVVVAVNKETNNLGEANSESAVTVTSDRLWLFSAVELCGGVDWAKGENAYANNIWNSEGAEYKLFRDLSVKPASPNAVLIKTLNGNPCNWWERSPHPIGGNSFVGVGKEGSPNYGWDASNSRGVVPGFCI